MALHDNYVVKKYVAVECSILIGVVNYFITAAQSVVLAPMKVIGLQ